jgi:ribonuclease-3
MTEFLELEEILGSEFADKSLLLRALTHRSYLNEHPDFAFEDNQRLEFLGDAVLDFVTGEYLYHRFPELPEGPLTSLRSALVRRETLAYFAQQVGLDRHLLLGHGEDTSGGRARPATLCAAFEAVVGALYLDQGVDAVRSFFEPLIGPEVVHTLQDQLDKDDKSRLQELAQGRFRCTPHYSTVHDSGPDHAKVFTVQVTICGKVYGQGSGHSKQQAAQAAALQALERLEAEEIEELAVGPDDLPSNGEV